MTTQCAWCESETGEHTEGSHGICARHWCMEMLSVGMRPTEVRSRACHLMGDEIANPAMDAALEFKALEIV